MYVCFIKHIMLPLNKAMLSNYWHYTVIQILRNSAQYIMTFLIFAIRSVPAKNSIPGLCLFFMLSPSLPTLQIISMFSHFLHMCSTHRCPNCFRSFPPLHPRNHNWPSSNLRPAPFFLLRFWRGPTAVAQAWFD